MAEKNGQGQGRDFVGIHFTCCNVYIRVYKSKQGDRYVGFCPKCGKKVKLVVGSDGVNDRFFTAR
ncbi:MAG: endonuclease Q family protein [candidate division Zixibacteria bacterium]|nr:endonuclease Q family protein [candidate division Zixibacteria bacterium]MBU1472115.1 endonuclease Q family protein [candidate division Zixibacteria bacterium]MBU2626234.1 endonuclease Q family protein [candidate division Zixibacteria bacterium]